jgi:putative heme-binding domain-containing protein
MTRPIALATALAFVCLARPLVAQEHSYAPADIDAGRGIYMGACTGCHGQAGDGVPGADLSTGRFRRGSSDEDLIRVIRNGIPQTAMPPHDSLSVGDARTVVAFLRSLPAGGGIVADDREVAIGAADAGRALFEGRGECTSCHSVNGDGGLLGPDLGRVGSQRSPAELELALLEPNADVRSGNRIFRVVDVDGNAVTGRLLNQDTHSVQLLSTDEDLVAFMKTGLREFGFTESVMPSYRGEFSDAEIADLVGYLVSLRGGRGQ